MKSLDVAALVLLVAAAVRAAIGVAGVAPLTWRGARRWVTAVAAGLGAAAAAGGALAVVDALAVVAVAECHGRVWALVGERLRGRADPTIAMAAGTLMVAGVMVQARMAGGVGSALVAAGVAATAAIAVAVGWRWWTRLLDHGTVILTVGLAVFLVASLLSRGRLAAVPVPFGQVQVGDAARLLVLLGTALVVVERPLQMAAVRDHRPGRLSLAPSLSRIGPITLAWATAVAAAAFTRDFGGAALLLLELAVVLAATTGRAWPLVVSVPTIVAAVAASDRLTSLVHERVEVWLHPSALPAGHQHVVALSAWADGGWWGLGWGAGRPAAIPAGRSDYVLAAIGQELGAVGCAALVAMVAVLVAAAARVAVRSDPRTSAIAVVAGAFVAIQATVVVLGSTGALPLTGVPFPWLSAGGAALVVNSVAVALLLVSSAHALPAAVSVQQTPAAT